MKKNVYILIIKSALKWILIGRSNNEGTAEQVMIKYQLLYDYKLLEISI